MSKRKTYNILLATMFIVLLLSFTACSNGITVVFVTNSDTQLENLDLNFSTQMLPRPYRDGYTFEGWFLEEDFTTKTNSKDLLRRYKGKTEVKLYAKWTKD
ncbi:MAG: InlB B-repeat-containing protein [Clostridia bacterium]